jgi:hypothetical protein
MEKIIEATKVFAAVLLIAALIAGPAMAQSKTQKAADCSTYARNRAESEGSTGGGMLSGGLRGAAGGALFGAIIGGSKETRRGAALGGGLGAIRGGVRSERDREGRYQYYYDSCMRGAVSGY